MGNSKRYVLFVLMCLLMPLLQTSLASAQPNIESNDLTIFQEDGLVFNETLYLNGSSNLPLADSKWFLIDLADELLEVLDTGTLSNVMAVGEGKWDWSLEISVTMYNCTCGFLVSGEASNHPPHIGLIVYLGSTNHHPHILPFRTIEQGMDIPLYMLAKLIQYDHLCHQIAQI